MSAQPPSSTDDTVVTWAAFAVWSLVAILAAMLSAVLIPVIVWGIPLPVGLLVVVVANVLLPRVFAQQIGIRGGAMVPGLIWLIVAIAAAVPTSGRDLILPSATYSAVWSMVYLGLGSVAAAFGAFTARTPLRGKGAAPVVGQ